MPGRPGLCFVFLFAAEGPLQKGLFALRDQAPMSVEVMTWVWKHSRARGTDKLILLFIADCADADGTNAWPGIDLIAQRCTVDPRTAQRSISKLIALGELRREPQAGGNADTRSDRRPNRYQVLMNGVTQTSPRQANGVTDLQPRGDTQVLNGVTPTSPYPSHEPSPINRHAAFSEKSRPTSRDWQGLEEVREEVERLGFDDLLDPEFWRNLENLTEGTQVYYLEELRQYAVWLETKPPAERHRNRKIGFMRWVKRTMAQIEWTKRREEMRRHAKATRR